MFSRLRGKSAADVAEYARWYTRNRLPGVPRTPAEASESLALLASMRTMGWQKSVRSMPRDLSGTPMPWLSISAIRFLDSLDLSAARMLEFGSGASTMWFAKRVDQLVSVEHDPRWAARVTRRANTELLVREAPDDPYYFDSSEPYLRDAVALGPYDIVLIDGVGRVTCAQHVQEVAADGALVILDDTQAEATKPATDHLSELGMRRLDFWGFHPGVGTDTCTSVFARSFDAWLETA